MKINPFVFFLSAALILLFVVLGLAMTDTMGRIFDTTQDFIATYFGWFYTVSVGFFLFFVIFLLFSPYGGIKLGKDDEEPEFSTLSWFAMLFSAGMGIGLLFYSVAEPILHFTMPPDAEPGTIEAAREAMLTTFFHWGLHPWAIYIVIGLSLAYFSYRHNLPLTIRSCLYPLLGKHIYGPLGNLMEVMAVVGTLFGVATSLGLGVMQINAGLDYLGWLDVSVRNQIILIAVITLIATISVVSGVNVGIRRLSELNIFLGTVLVLFVFIAGPTVFLLGAFIQSLGVYLQNLVQMTFDTDAFSNGEWRKSWTLFYWGWWIAWSPFVGMFVARVSRGRTIRQFVLGVLFAPTLLAFFWLVVFGQTAIRFEMLGDQTIGQAVANNLPVALYELLAKLPYANITAFLATLVIATYFVTSSDSASLVIDILTADGHPDPPVPQRIFWALLEGTVAAVLLLVGGKMALTALQTAAITTALPFCGIMILICWSLYIGLKQERQRQLRKAAAKVVYQGEHALAGMAAATGLPEKTLAEMGQTDEEVPPEVAVEEKTKGRRKPRDWRKELKHLYEVMEKEVTTSPAIEAQESIKAFFDEKVLPAFKEIKKEVEKYGRTAKIEHLPFQAELTILKDGEEEYSYSIIGHAYQKPRFAFPEMEMKATPRVLRAEISRAGGKPSSYAIREFTREGIIQDFIQEYSKWMNW
jgi:choline/glycine/proline betaine transport protein